MKTTTPNAATVTQPHQEVQYEAHSLDRPSSIAARISCLITRIAFGFKSPEALIAIAMLSLGGHRPALPGRKMTYRSIRRAGNCVYARLMVTS